jgi:hypothetical protein
MSSDVDPIARVMWIAVAVLVAVVIALLLHASVVALPLLLVGGAIVGVAQHMSWRRNRRR